MSDAATKSSGVTLVEGNEGKPVAHVIVPNTASGPVGQDKPPADAAAVAAPKTEGVGAGPATKSSAAKPSAVAAKNADAAAEPATSSEAAVPVEKPDATAGRRRVFPLRLSAAGAAGLVVMDWVLGVIDRPFARLGRTARGVIGLVALGTLTLSGAAVALRPIFFPAYDIGAELKAAVVEASKPPPAVEDAGRDESASESAEHGKAEKSADHGGGSHEPPKSGGAAQGAAGHH